jgi:hypothetical protein
MTMWLEYGESALQIASCSWTELQFAECQMNGKMAIFICCTITKSLRDREEGFIKKKKNLILCLFFRFQNMDLIKTHTHTHTHTHTPLVPCSTEWDSLDTISRWQSHQTCLAKGTMYFESTYQRNLIMVIKTHGVKLGSTILPSSPLHIYLIYSAQWCFT